MYNKLNKISSEIKEYFRENLVSIVVFGSTPNKKRSFKITSDIDYIIISRKLESHQDFISRTLKKKLEGEFPLVAFNIYQENEFSNILSHNPWLVLTIKLGHKALFDRGDFFRRSLETHYKKLKYQRVGWLSWRIEKWNPSQKIRDYYLDLSDKYLGVAQLLYRRNIDIALELLKFSVHCFMIEKLMARKIFITKGEITQLFFNIYSKNIIVKFRNSFLTLEQKANLRHSFDFNKSGDMFPSLNTEAQIKSVFKNALKNFRILKKSFEII